MTARFIYCHPLFDERKCGHRFSYQLSQAFAAKGLELERFDYGGTGEADGEFEEVTLETLRRDLAEFAGQDDVNLIGVRLGASLAFEYAAKCGGHVEKLVLIEPVIDGAGYVDYLSRKQRIKDVMTGRSDVEGADNGFVNIEGFKTCRELLEQIRSFALASVPVGNSSKPDVLVAQVSRGSDIRGDVSEFVSTLNGFGGRIAVESFSLPDFWERVPEGDYGCLTNKIVEWCNG